jgi:hypothetical protein
VHGAGSEKPLNFLPEFSENDGGMRNSWLLLGLSLGALAPCGCDSIFGAGEGAHGSSIAVGEGKNYRVRPGDSLFSIAERAYGNGLEWPRIWEANPWLQPDRVTAGETIYLPPRDASWGDPPSRQNYALNPGTGNFETEEVGEATEAPAEAGAVAPARSSDPPSGGAAHGPSLQVFRNLANNVSSKTFLGMPVEKTFLLGFSGFAAHAIFQGILVWLAANITFVKDATFRKSLKAVFLTESLTFVTIFVLAGVAILFVYLGSEPGASGDSRLFPALERQLQNPAGIGIAGVTVLVLYVILSLRFLPLVFSIPASRATALMVVSILLPHLIGAYFVGQRAGWIH